MINALQNIINQGKRLDSVNLDTGGDYESMFTSTDKNPVPFLLDLPKKPADAETSTYSMTVQFQDRHIGTYLFGEGTFPVVKIIKVFSSGSEARQFQAIY